MGRKNVIKMIVGIYQQILSSWELQPSSRELGLLEFLYDEYQKKYGNVKLAEKKIL